MRTLGGLAVAVVVSISLASCGSSAHPASSAAAPTSPAEPTSSAPSADRSALARWNEAYSYLSSRVEPTEIFCTWMTVSNGDLSPVPRRVRFFSFSDRAAWRSHLITRNGPFPDGPFEDCLATVPTTVPYGPAIETFLSRFGLTFLAGANATGDRTPIEIAYAGQNPADPDIIYRDAPGLFGLRMALAALGKAPFEPGTSKIIQPTDEATAARYLRYATPLLTWYRSQG